MKLTKLIDQTKWGNYLFEKILKRYVCDSCGKLVPRWSYVCGICDDCFNIETEWNSHMDNGDFENLIREGNKYFEEEE